MKNKLLLVLLVIVLISTGCGKNTKKDNKDALNFKKEYESLNDKKNANGVEHRAVSIDEDNPFIYAKTEEIIKMYENGDTFYVYFGDTQCPWCRSVIEKAIQVAKKNKIEKIYYVKIWDDDHNEILRDKYIVDEDGNASKDIDGTKDYYKLLEIFDNVLSLYTLKDNDGNQLLEEKRIYAPNFIYVKNGKAEMLVEGISKKQKDAREELTKELLKDEEKEFNKIFKKNK